MLFWIELCGWGGMLLILWAYYLISTGKTTASAHTYQWLNLTGAIALGVNVFYKQSWPAVGLEIIWAGIAIKTLLTTRR